MMFVISPGFNDEIYRKDTTEIIPITTIGYNQLKNLIIKAKDLMIKTIDAITVRIKIAT
jgi:hypothetical protein